MSTNRVRLFLSISSVLFSSLLYAQSRPSAPAPVLQDARIEVNHRADSTGVIRVRVTPVGQEPIETTINILDRMSENDVAADIEKELTVALGGTYRVDRTGGEHVRIRKTNRETSPDFTLEISFNAVGLAIIIQD